MRDEVKWFAMNGEDALKIAANECDRVCGRFCRYLTVQCKQFIISLIGRVLHCQFLASNESRYEEAGGENPSAGDLPSDP